MLLANIVSVINQNKKVVNFCFSVLDAKCSRFIF